MRRSAVVSPVRALKWHARLAAVLIAAGGMSQRAWSVPLDNNPATAAPQPPAAPASQPTTGPAQRTLDDVMQDVSNLETELGTTIQDYSALFDKARCAQIAPKALPIAKKIASLQDQAIEMAPQLLRIRRARLELSALMSMLGDPDGTAMLQKMTVSTDREEAVSAISWQRVISFVQAGRDPNAQQKVVDDLAELARTNPENDMIAQAVAMITPQAANKEIAANAEKIVTDVLQGPMAQRMSAELIADRKLHALENRPLTVEGQQVDGAKFTSADWKGKVVVVHFWATWSGPSEREFRRLKPLYDKEHAHGLEIVGVSSDTDPDFLKAFMKKNPTLSWPELFDPAAAAANRPHPFAELCTVQTLPTLFVIDRKGIVRTVTGEQDLDKIVPQLLEEKP